MLAMPTKLAMLATVTTWPLLCLIMSGKKARQVYQWDSRLTPKILCSSSGDVSMMVCEAPMPALLMRIDGFPKLDLIWSATRETASALVISQRKSKMLSGRSVNTQTMD